MHIRRAYRFLNPWGVLVAVMSPHALFAEDGASRQFRMWVNQVEGTWAPLPSGTFAEEGTNVETKLLTIRGQANALTT
jgi:hypothetical protein